jgi:hypothetical protein
LASGERAAWLGSRWLDIVLRYEIAPFTLAAVALSLTRRRSTAAPPLELCAALLWCVAFLSFALWYPMFNTIEHLGAPLVDALAVVVGLAAVAFIGVAVQGLIATGLSGQSLLQAIGVGALGIYLGHVSLLFYESTRTTGSGGFEAILWEARLRVYACGLAAVALITSTVLPKRTGARSG